MPDREASAPEYSMSRGRMIRVWDLPTRLFHWALVALVGIGLVTGFMAAAWWMGVHVWAGYGIGLLLLFRLVWAAFGSEPSTLASLVDAARRVRGHLRALVLLRPSRQVGHTPLGTVMIFVLVAVLIGLTTTGLVVLGGEEKQGPLKGLATYALGHGARAIHEALAISLLFLVGGHLLGVAVESALARENLVRSMITGWKCLPPELARGQLRPARPIAAAVTMAAVVGGLALLIGHLGGLPTKGYRVLAPNAVYSEECGACHDAYHPSLLPAASWSALMAGLADHFGEDADLPTDRAEPIRAWLVANSAETWDTEAANRLRVTSPAEPARITATPFWRRTHKELPDAVFARAAIRTRAHCSACHGDAASGRFDDQPIAIPKAGPKE